MGCQCAKNDEKANMSLENNSAPQAPPKVVMEVQPARKDSEKIIVDEKVEVQKAVANTNIEEPLKEIAKDEPQNNDNSKLDNSKLENSKVNESKQGGKKKKKKKAAANFNEELFQAINNVRANPSAYASKIEEAISQIKVEEGKIIFEAEGGNKIALVKGEDAFKNAANKLRNMNAVGPLEFRDDLVIPVPEDPKDWKKQDQITAALGKRRAENGTKYTEYLFNMDLGVSEPEVSLLLQIVDDSPFKGKRCDNILNKDFKYVGISHQKQGKSKFCCYLTFSK